MRSGITARRSLMAGALAAGTLAATGLTAGAAPITIANHSFETSSGSYGDTAFPGFTAVDVDPGQEGNQGGSYIGSSKPALSTAVGTGGDGTGYAEFAYGNRGLAQTTSYVVQTGDMFTLTAAIGNKIGNPGDNTAADYVGLVQLLIDGTVVASNLLADTGTPIEGGFANASTFYTATALDAGKTIGVQVVATTGNQKREFDNLRLDVAAVPEPGSFALAGGAALLGLVRRRRTS